MSEISERWWQPRSVEVGEGWSWQLGPLDLEVRRIENEWQIAYDRSEGGDGEESGWSVRPADGSLENAPNVERFAAGSANELELRPRVADRTLVAEPRTPLNVLPGERARAYLSSPIWVDVRVGPPSRSLGEIATRRLSDTWVGTTTLEGEVAYSLKTLATLRHGGLPRMAYRCITPVFLANTGPDILPIARMNLPIPFLSIYAAEDGNLWTEAVSLIRSEDAALAKLEIHRGPPEEATGAERVSGARQQAEPNLLVRAFATLLRGFGDDDDG